MKADPTETCSLFLLHTNSHALHLCPLYPASHLSPTLLHRTVLTWKFVYINSHTWHTGHHGHGPLFFYQCVTHCEKLKDQSSAMTFLYYYLCCVSNSCRDCDEVLAPSLILYNIWYFTCGSSHLPFLLPAMKHLIWVKSVEVLHHTRLRLFFFYCLFLLQCFLTMLDHF